MKKTTIQSHEAKLFLKPEEALTENGDLTEKVKQLFSLSKITRMSVAYLDSNEKTANKDGWTLRVRKKDSSSKTEFTFKKRYPAENLQDAIEKANADGFNGSNVKYESELDMGLSSKTLSFSYEKKEVTSAKENELPEISESIMISKKHMPIEFTENIDGFKHYGTVYVNRHKGVFEGHETTLELWKILNETKDGYEDIIEVSIKSESMETALLKQSAIKEALKKNNLLSDIDKMKTQMILDRY